MSNRRKFIKHLGVGSIGAAVMPADLLQQDHEKTTPDEKSHRFDAGPSKHAYNSSYTGEFLNRIAFPIGGIGAGMYCLEGTGAISHMSIRHRPDIFNEPGLFGALFIRGLKKRRKDP